MMKRQSIYGVPFRNFQSELNRMATPSAQPAAQAAATPAPRAPDNASPLILAALVVIAVLAGIAGVALYKKGKKKGA